MLPPRFADIAVPLPLHYPLCYAVPEIFGALTPGCRVRVEVGRRRLIGLVLSFREQPPAGAQIREVHEQLDLEPVLPPQLLELAHFTAEYYLAPIGEVIRVMLPGDLPPWGELWVGITAAGALALPRDVTEQALRELLLEQRKLRLADLMRQLPVPDLGQRIEALRAQGRLTVEAPGRSRRGLRYDRAVELRPGELSAHLAACGRSSKGRAVIEVLHALGRPATLEELQARVDCGPQVTRRLSELGLLREFTQPAHLSLARHRLLGDASPPELLLRPDQASAVERLGNAIANHEFAAFLLDGMTGSGKTEVFLRAAEVALEHQRTVLLLVPEIALVPALARSAVQRFGSRLAILHSNLSANERHQEWERVRQGEAQVVLGPRSALFAPLDRLGLVVVDEEHDAAYKQDNVPAYNGRDLALWLAQRHRAVAVLVSATPSLEARYNRERGKLQHLTLTARAGNSQLPEGILVDLRQEEVARRPGEVHFSQRLRQEIETALLAGDQIVLLRNRRGYAPSLLCRACGQDIRCPDCGLPLTVHRRADRLICHYCGFERAQPAACPACGEAALQPIGAGTERVEERFLDLFPGAAVDLLDADATRRTGGAAAVLERFASGKTQVLIGTQMVAKGHHFPRVALAAVMFADSYLGFPDFRAVERTYALLTQLGGRAGRGQRPGRVVIQTYHPDHYAIRAALEHRDELFVEEEMRFRRTFHYPPYTRMVQLLARHESQPRAAAMLRTVAARLTAHPLAEEVWIAGPAPAPLERLRGQWRFQLLLRSYSGSRLRQLVREVAGQTPASELKIDVDPYDLL